MVGLAYLERQPGSLYCTGATTIVAFMALVGRPELTIVAQHPT